MDVKVNFKEKTMILEYTANDKEIEILKQVKEDGYIELKSTSKDTAEEQILENMCESLYSSDFLYAVEEAWHPTYKLTARGERFIENILNK